MKKAIIIIVATLILSSSLYAVKYSFTYDAAGNRDSRTMVDINGKESVPIQKILDHEIKVYPNPTAGDLRVDISGITHDLSAEVELFDFNGRSVYKEGTPTGQVTIDLTEEPNGFYIMRISIDNQNIEYKVVKQK